MNIVERSKLLLLDVGASPILYLMIGLSLLSVAIIAERTLFFFRVRENLQELAAQLALALEQADLTSAKLLVTSSPSAESAIVAAGYSPGVTWEKYWENVVHVPRTGASRDRAMRSRCQGSSVSPVCSKQTRA